MKKIFGLILLSLLVLVGCKNKDNIDEVTRVTNYLSGLSSYSLTSKMTIQRPDKNVSVNVAVDYLSPAYYKVSFKGDNEQLIIKNDTGVYVITPSLNKEFRFDSNWPLNSSHAYLLEAINKDIKADTEATGSQEGTDIVIECKIAHKTNQKLNKMKYTCDANFKPKKTVFLNDKNEECIVVDFDTFTPNSNLGKDNFNEKKYLGAQEEKPNEEETSLTLTAGYVVEGSQLASSSKKDDTTILCYSGESSYTIIVSLVEVTDEVVAIDTYDSIEFLACGLGFINENTMKFYNGSYEITIFSNQLTIDDYINVANSITLA
ncbi:MAG: hypothetical protein K2M08_05535 [Anaeroplasmataceae bacterium]|nr:hypothetical protein [Anaeroplasmataceae bacterium]MDE6241859.1 hypothetical protein [Anaeroplasmataceae bacterium]